MKSMNMDTLVVGTPNQLFKIKFLQKNKVVTGKTLFFMIGPFCTPHSIGLTNGFRQGSFVWKCWYFQLKNRTPVF